MDINNVTYNSLKSYYSSLRKNGHVDNASVYNLLILTFIEEIINESSQYIKEDDYEVLTHALNCLDANTCNIVFNNEAIHSDPVYDYLSYIPMKITEDDIIRITEDTMIRLADM